MTRDTNRAGAFLVALGSVVAAMVLLAGPAAAQVSGGAYAEDGSVASGTADARDDSTASGDATARDESTASGCSTAIDESTASGGPCRRTPPPTKPPTKPPHKDHDDDDGKRKHKAGVGGGHASTATGTSTRLALTGSSTAPLTAGAALFVVAGVVLVVASRRRTDSV